MSKTTDTITLKRNPAGRVDTARRPGQYDAFLWLELIAFDNCQPDMGVQAFLDGLGFVPTGLSVFMWGPDFVHQHAGTHEDRAFPPDIGAYLDCFYFDQKKPGPAWTIFQLKRLVAEFHKRSVEVYFSVMPNSLGNRFHHEWLSDHPEVEVIPQEDYTPWFPMLHPLKRLKDGTFYEDFFAAKVSEVCRDYGFDGIHLVDGYNHGWYQLCDAEYSDDMVDQFLAHSGIALGEGVPRHCGLVKPEIARRARWIWQHQRRAWIHFHVDRWETFFRKMVTALHAGGHKVAANTCWTRDPVESIYRYGIDYKKIAATGVDRFVIETCGAGGEMLNRVCRARFSVPFFHVIKTTSLVTRAYIPQAEIHFNNCTQDITEGWSTLRHSPAFLEREIYSYSNLYHHGADGVPKRTFDGMNVCLAADMEPVEWRWLKERWDSAFDFQPQAVGGLTLVWSDDAVYRELEEYIQTRANLTHNVVYHLSAKGVPISSTVGVRDVAGVKGPLLVVNPHLFPAAQIERILGAANSPVVMIGPKRVGTRPPDFHVSDVSASNPLQLFIYGAMGNPPAVVPAAEQTSPIDLDTVKEAPSFFDEMYFTPVSDGFYNACVKAIEAAIRPTLRLDLAEFPHGEWAGVQTFRKNDTEHRCFLWNDEFRYVDTRFAAESRIGEIRMVSRFRGRPIRSFDDEAETWTAAGNSGHRFIVRIPPKGIGVIDIRLEG